MTRKFDNPDLIITDAMTCHAKFQPSKPAIIFKNQALTWNEFNQRVNKVANALIGLGLTRGDKVSLLTANRIEVPEITFGTIKAGGVIVPLSTLLQGPALTKMINDSDSKFVFVSNDLRQKLDPYRAEFVGISENTRFVIDAEVNDWSAYSELLSQSSEREPYVALTYGDDFNIMYTSGTTGEPKGILHTHHNRLHFAILIATELKINSSSIGIAAVTLNTNGSWIILLPTLFFGGTLVIMPGFDPKSFLETVQKEKCTHTFLVPTQYSALLRQPDLYSYDLSSMETWLTGGSPLKKNEKEEILEKFPGDLVELWGCTEGPCTTILAKEMRRKMDSVGRPPYGGDLCIIDDDGNEIPRGGIGEIVGVNPFIMAEYYKQPNKTQEAIWTNERGKQYFKTGDIGRIDEDGYLYIMDRKRDMIKSGGINVFASDIEMVFNQHPGVREVTVIAVPDPKWGETPLALIVRNEGTVISEKELAEWGNSKLGSYQRVSRVEFRTNLPHNLLGKVLKRELREPYWKS